MASIPPTKAPHVPFDDNEVPPASASADLMKSVEIIQ